MASRIFWLNRRCYRQPRLPMYAMEDLRRAVFACTARMTAGAEAETRECSLRFVYAVSMRRRFLLDNGRN